MNEPGGGQRSNRTLVRRLLLVVVAMFGFGFALVPLYDVFCDVTGINGKTNRVAEQADGLVVDQTRWVTVEFVGSVQSDLPWSFGPNDVKMRVHPGQLSETTYYAENLSDRAIIGQAVPSVAPGVAAKYFRKIECFCFSQQELAAGARRDMPVRFVVEPGLPPEIGTVTLSYTFFESKNQPDAEQDHSNHAKFGVDAEA
ncbi:MAG: cytochrome c oxidase assembly protein [Gammaproteobacteria bacterium]|nr:cytochrome c oxidase assembly protein [Gammaproteobacteria bacterium]